MRNDSTRRTWQLIGATAALSLAVTLGTGWALRAFAQDAAPAAPAPAPGTAAEAPRGAAPPDDDAAGPDGDALPDEESRRAPEPVASPDPPELRESADNNISFPVDI